MDLMETCGTCAENVEVLSPHNLQIHSAVLREEVWSDMDALSEVQWQIFHCLLLWRVCYFLRMIFRLGKYLEKLLNCDYLGVADVGKLCLGCWVLQGIG